MHPRRKLMHALSTVLLCSLLIGVFTVAAMPNAQAQTRVNDHDMKALMQNLHDDSKSFLGDFDNSIKKSTIRKTSQAKDARDQAKVFARQTGHLLDRFKKDHNGHAEFNDVMATAEQLNATIHSVHVDRKTRDRWHKIRAELRRIADAYGVPFELGNGGI